MTSSFGGWNNTMSWISAEEMSFGDALKAYGMTSLPLISEIQDPDEADPDPERRRRRAFDGGLIRLCQVSVTPTDGARASRSNTTPTGQCRRCADSTRSGRSRRTIRRCTS